MREYDKIISLSRKIEQSIEVNKNIESIIQKMLNRNYKQSPKPADL